MTDEEKKSIEEGEGLLGASASLAELEEAAEKSLEVLFALREAEEREERARSLSISDRANVEQWQARKHLRKLRVLGLAEHYEAPAVPSASSAPEEGTTVARLRHYWRLTDLGRELAAAVEAKRKDRVADGVERLDLPVRPIVQELLDEVDEGDPAKAETLPAVPETAPELDDEVPPVVLEEGGEP